MATMSPAGRVRSNRPVGGFGGGSCGRSGAPIRRVSHQPAAAPAAITGAARRSMRRNAIESRTLPSPRDAGYPAPVDLGLDGKVALVTGASAGIGLGIARALAAEGAKVAITSRTRERVEAAASEIGATPFAHDNTDLDGIPTLVDSVERELGPVDVLVLNTGGPPGNPDPLGFGQEQWRDAHRELVLAPVAMIERIVPGMRERGFGRVLSISSSAAREPIPNLLLSSSHRSALLATFKTLAHDAAADGVTFNTILPGRIATDRLAHLYGSLEAAAEVARDEVPAGRLGTVEEIAAVGVFLCSVPASYLTGAAVRVDGGLSRAT
jgi:3-oxoacyl-[acyl-carrier protein] reductase